MITTTLAVLALAGSLTTGASPSPGWQPDYAQALTAASEQRKPIAVFIGQGSDKVKQMLSDGRIPSESARLLRDNYVSVFLDTETSTGRELSAKFELSEGLVISGPGGTHQALRHSGILTGSDLTRQLEKFAAAGQPATTLSSSTGSPVITGVVTSAGSAPVIVSGGRTVVPTTGYVIPSSPTGYVIPSSQPFYFGGTNCAPGRR
jgi:hypothetical protein